jgi:hypothetical protein
MAAAYSQLQSRAATVGRHGKTNTISDNRNTIMAAIATGLTRMTDVQVIQFARNVHMALTGNLNVPNPYPTLPVLQNLISTAESCRDAYEVQKSILRSKKSLRDEALRALCDGLRLLANTVQAATGGDPDKMKTTGFLLGKRPSPVGTPVQVTELALEAGATEGTLKASWKPVRGVKVYEVETNSDGAAALAWAHKDTVTKAKAHLNSFVSGCRIWVRVRAIGTAGPGSWSEPVVKTVP